jgi:hypothetical protein
MGAVLGGLVENVSMIWGLNVLNLVAETESDTTLNA